MNPRLRFRRPGPGGPARLSGCLAPRRSPQAASPPAKEAAATRFKNDVVPFLAKHCYSCHGNGKNRGDLTLDKYQDADAIVKDREVWEHVVEMVQTGEMPPKAKSRPRPNPPRPTWRPGPSTRCARPVRLQRLARGRPRHDPQAQPDRIQQHDPRPRRRRLQARRRLPQRRRRLRLRQHRRRPLALAPSPGKVPLRRRVDPRPGHRHQRPAQTDDPVARAASARRSGPVGQNGVAASS